MTPLLTGSRSPPAASRRVRRLIGAATRTAHLAVWPVIWASLAAAVLDRRPPRTTFPAAEAVTEAVPAEPPAPRPVPPGVSAAGAWRQRARAYILLTKPRVIELLLVTTVPAMVFAEGDFPSPLLIAAVLIGGALAAGGDNELRHRPGRETDYSTVAPGAKTPPTDWPSCAVGVTHGTTSTPPEVNSLRSGGAAPRRLKDTSPGRASP